jgi:hypothetical protein
MLANTRKDSKAAPTTLGRVFRWLLPRSVYYWVALLAIAAWLTQVTVDAYAPQPSAVVATGEESPVAILDSTRWLAARKADGGWTGPVLLRDGRGITLRSILPGRRIAAVAVAPDARTAVVVEAEPPRVYWWNLETGDSSAKDLSVDFPVRSALATCSATSAAVDLRGDPNRNAAFLLASKSASARRLPNAAAPFAFSHDGSLLASVGSSTITDVIPKVEKKKGSHRVLVWNLLAPGEPRVFSGFDGRPQYLDFSPADKKLMLLGKSIPPNWTYVHPESCVWDLVMGTKIADFGPVVGFPDERRVVIWYAGQAEANQLGMVTYLAWKEPAVRETEHTTPRYWAPDKNDLFMPLERTTRTAYFIGDGYLPNPLEWVRRLQLPQSYYDKIRERFGGAQRRGLTANAFDIATGDHLAEIPVPSAGWAMLASPTGDALGLAPPDGSSLQIYRGPPAKRWAMAIAVAIGVTYVSAVLLRIAFLLLRRFLIFFFRGSRKTQNA